MGNNNFFKTIKSYLQDAQNQVNILFYFAAAGAIWYLYNFNIVLLITLFLIAIFAMTSLLTDLILWVRTKKMQKSFAPDIVVCTIIIPLVLLFFPLKAIAYVVVLSLVVVGIVFFRKAR